MIAVNKNFQIPISMEKFLQSLETFARLTIVAFIHIISSIISRKPLILPRNTILKKLIINYFQK